MDREKIAPANKLLKEIESVELEINTIKGAETFTLSSNSYRKNNTYFSEVYLRPDNKELDEKLRAIMIRTLQDKLDELTHKLRML